MDIGEKEGNENGFLLLLKVQHKKKHNSFFLANIVTKYVNHAKVKDCMKYFDKEYNNFEFVFHMIPLTKQTFASKSSYHATTHC